MNANDYISYLNLDVVNWRQNCLVSWKSFKNMFQMKLDTVGGNIDSFEEEKFSANGFEIAHMMLHSIKITSDEIHSLEWVNKIENGEKLL